MAERIQKLLASAGAGSRRQIERWIIAGRILIDGRPARLGDQLTGDERVSLDGKPLKLVTQEPEHSHLAYYKPSGEITTRDDPEGRPTIFDAIRKPKHGRWVSIGRLDLNTSGLLLLTTDGALAHRLMHPSYEIQREYAVRLLGSPTDEQYGQLQAGVELDDGLARFEQVSRVGGSGRNEWFHVTLREGRNREVRRMFDALGLTVSRLIRVRYGPIHLERLARGKSRSLAADEITALYGAVGLPVPIAAASAPRHRGDKPPGSRGRRPGSQAASAKPTQQSVSLERRSADRKAPSRRGREDRGRQR